MILLHCPRRTPLSRHRDENRVTAIPLESTLTKNRGEGTCPLRSHHSLHVRRVYIHRHRSLDQFKRNDHAQIALFPLQDAFQPRERSRYDPYSSSHGQKRMRLGAQATLQTPSQCFDLFRRQRRGGSIEPDELGDARYLQDLQTIAKSEVNENVTGKQRQLQLHAAVFPAALGIIQRQEVFDRSLSQLQGDALFMVRARVHGIPMGLVELRREARTLGWTCYVRRDASHVC